MNNFKTIFHSISKAVFMHVGVGAALLSGCTNNEYPAHKKPMPYDFMTPTQKARLYQKGMERSAREEQLKYDLEEEGYKVEYGGGLY